MAAFSIEGHAERSGAGLRAVLVLRDRNGAQLGERELESAGADCGDLREKVSLVVALMIDPEASLHAPPPAPSGSPAPPTPPVSAPPASAGPPAAPAPPTAAVPASSASIAPAPPPLTEPAAVHSDERPGRAERDEVPVDLAPPAPWNVESALSAAVGVGFLPSASLGGILDATVLPPRFWPVRLYAGGWGSQTVAASSAASARFSSAFGGLALCPLRARSGRVSVLACGAGQVGVVSAAPSGFESAHGGMLLTFHLVPDVHMSVALASGISVRAGGSLAVGLRRSQFVFETTSGQQALFDSPLLAATVDLGVAIALP